MPLFEYKDNEALGCVVSVDTATVTIRVDDIERLRRIQVNRLTSLAIEPSSPTIIERPDAKSKIRSWIFPAEIRSVATLYKQCGTRLAATFEEQLALLRTKEVDLR
jgi:hypothetical protein